jgi:hypothetical protein
MPGILEGSDISARAIRRKAIVHALNWLRMLCW